MLDKRHNSIWRILALVGGVAVVLVGLYWGGRWLLDPSGQKRQAERTKEQQAALCPAMHTSIREATAALGGDYQAVCGLDLSGNNYSQLTGGIIRFSGLAVLDVSSNRLTALPEGLGDLKNLRSLDLSKNDLRELPEDIFSLINLAVLDVRDNPLPIETVERLRGALSETEVYF